MLPSKSSTTWKRWPASAWRASSVTTAKKTMRALLQRAYLNYKAWGVRFKFERIEERLSTPTAGPARSNPNSGSGRTLISTTQTHSSTTSSDHLDEAMDLRTVLKASQAIAGDIILSTLLEKLVNILIENAGADRGCLPLEQGGSWSPAASASLSLRAAAAGRTRPRAMPAASVPPTSQGTCPLRSLTLRPIAGRIWC